MLPLALSALASLVLFQVLEDTVVSPATGLRSCHPLFLEHSPSPGALAFPCLAQLLPIHPSAFLREAVLLFPYFKE